MRRLTILAVAAFSLSNLLGCEDGPKQTYEPSPPSAAGTFNDGCNGVDSTDPNKCPRAVDTPAKGGFDEPDGGFGNNAQEICTGPEKKDIWGKMIRLAVEPPRYAAGLDMAGDNTWKGLTIEQAEQGYVYSPEPLDGVSLDNKQVGCNDQTQRCVRPGTATDTYEQIINPGDNWKLCQSDAGGYTFGQNSWGDGGEVDVSYYVGTRIITALSINPGYKGAMITKSRDGQHSYIFPVTGAGSAQITKDGQPLALDWTNATDSASVIQEIYDSMIATYAPALPPESPGVSCATTGHCIIGNFGAPYYMFVPSIGFGFVVATIQAGPVVASSPFNFQIYKTKLLAFSTADAFLKFDAEGPVAKTIAGPQMKSCELKMGMTYADFLANCVQVTGDQTKDQAELNKLLGGLTHGTERFYFDIVGVDINFTDNGLAADDVVRDKDVPTPDDFSTEFDFDQSALGALANDYVNNDVTQGQDYHGAGLVYLEYARLTQTALQGYRTDVCDPKTDSTVTCDPDLKSCKDANGNDCAPIRTVGDPACQNPTQDPNTGEWMYGRGCTGMETFVTSAPPLPAGMVPTDDPYINNIALSTKAVGGGVASGALAVGLKPGQPQAVFCTNLDGKSIKNCGANHDGTHGALFATSLARAVEVFGHNSMANMPINVRDGRFFFRQYVTALAKYFIAVGEGHEDVQGVHNADYNPDDLFFDSLGNGQFEQGEYIDRHHVAENGVATDLNVTADVKNGIMNDYLFSRDFYRGEEALYTAMLDYSDPNVTPQLGGDKGDNVLLTNIFGSTVLTTAYGSSPDPYHCATTWDASSQKFTLIPDTKNCGSALPPLDANGKVQVDALGRPVLAPYKGALTCHADASGNPVCGQTEFMFGERFYADPNDPTGQKKLAIRSGIKITSPKPDIQGITVTIPLHTSPFFASVDPTDPMAAAMNAAPAGGNATVTKFVPWTPKQPGSGFYIPTSQATIDAFIESFDADFSGTTIATLLDYDVAHDPNTLDAAGNPVELTDGSIVVKAVESEEFLGDVFLCQDPATGDILSARMYSTVEGIVDWIANHGGNSIKETCGLVIRYSPYNNFADYITSTQNGVRLSVTQGGGFGRVVDAVLYDPTIVAPN